jgi:hypothetical protein
MKLRASIAFAVIGTAAVLGGTGAFQLPATAGVGTVSHTTRPALPPDSGLAGCTALAGTHQVAAADYPAIGFQFAGSRWPDLRFGGLAYIEIATKLLATHAYGGETAWFYQRLSAACAKHGRPLPF